MIRNLKALGLALTAVLAMAALSASAASAQTLGKLTVDSGTSATLDGTEIGTGENRLTAFGETYECPGSKVFGHEFNTTPHVPVPAGATKVTLTPEFVNCFAQGADGVHHKMTVTMTSCDFEAEIGETTGGVANTYGISFGIKCNNEPDTIHIDIYPFANSELGGIACSITIHPKTGMHGAHLTTDTVNSDLVISGQITTVKATKSGSACSTETTEAAVIDINATVKGTNGVGGNVGITVTH